MFQIQLELGHIFGRSWIVRTSIIPDSPTVKTGEDDGRLKGDVQNKTVADEDERRDVLDPICLEDTPVVERATSFPTLFTICPGKIFLLFEVQ